MYFTLEEVWLMMGGEEWMEWGTSPGGMVEEVSGGCQDRPELLVGAALTFAALNSAVS